MNIVRQITISKDAWEDFTNRLSQYNMTKQEKVDAFLSEIENNISIKRENNQIFVKSCRIDENTILAALYDV